jgi:hypothetical protein
MNSLTIDLTKKYYADIKCNDGFSEVGFGNIICIIGLLLDFINDHTRKIYIKVDKNISKKTYNDTLNIINNLKFGNFDISLYNDIDNLIEIDDILKLNDKSNNDYILSKRHVKNVENGFYHATTYKKCKKLNISFKNEDKILSFLKYDDINIFNLIHKKFVVINIRRNEKLNLDNYLIVDKLTCENIINSMKNEKILFISDDINWCFDNFSKYDNVYFYNCKTEDKPIIDQYILHKSSIFFGNLDCSFSTIPLTLSTNNIKDYYFFCKNDQYEYELNNKYSRFNFFKNSELCDRMFLIGC